jgi:hypothetical protein
MSAVAQGRDAAGQFASVDHSAPDVALAEPLDIEGLRGTLEDFLDGSLPGFAFDVYPENVEIAVSHLIDELVEAHRGA